jgi:hypothetical protein
MAMAVKITWDLSTVTSCIGLSVRIVTKSPKWRISTYILHLSDKNTYWRLYSDLCCIHGFIQRHILRDRRPSTAACPACWAMGPKEMKIVHGEEKNILYWAEKISQGRTKISCTSTTSPANQSRKDPLHLYSLNPHSPQYQQSAEVHSLFSVVLFINIGRTQGRVHHIFNLKFTSITLFTFVLI